MHRLPRSTPALVLLLSAGLARAEAPAPAPPPAEAVAAAPAAPARPDRRAVNGHQFLPSTIVNAPLAVSSFGMDDRLSYGSATGQRYDAAGNPTGEARTYDFGGMVMGVRFQAALTEALALRGAFTVSVFSGTDSPSALVVGTTLQPGLALGAEWSRALGDQWRVGLSLDADKSPQLNLLVMAAIVNAIQNGVVEGAGVLQQADVTTWAPAFSAAWAPSPAIGLVGRLGYVDSSMETATAGTLRRQAIAFGAAVDVDLQRYWPSVPLGANLAYADSVPVADSISGVRDLSLGLMYTGHEDLAVGVTVGNQVLRIRPQYPDPLKTSSPYLTFVMRAYWP